jgi:quinol monooxygenase YgiN
VTALYGFTGRFTAHPGKADALAGILLEAADGLQGNDACLLYLVARSETDADAVTVTEVWTGKEVHDASLQSEEAKEAIQRARPLIAGISGSEFQPVGGKGI